MALNFISQAIDTVFMICDRERGEEKEVIEERRWSKGTGRGKEWRGEGRERGEEKGEPGKREKGWNGGVRNGSRENKREGERGGRRREG